MVDQKDTSIDLDELAENEGFNNSEEMIFHYFSEGVVPALCSEGCQVEPDGICEHGNQSFMLGMG